jgi:YD repeat-containing protein
MKTPFTLRPALCLLFILTPCALRAQVATGTPPFGTFGGGPETINLANLNAHLGVPVLNKQGRAGMNFTYVLSYDSSVWYPTSVNGVQTWQPVANWGWRGQTEIAVGYVSYKQHFHQCPVRGDGNYIIYDTYVYHDMFGIAHAYAGSALFDCNGTFNGFTETASDDSGYKINATDTGVETITSASGEIFNPSNAPVGSGAANDTNGNQITVNSNGQFFDTLSSTTPVLTVSGAAPNPVSFTYTAPSGASASYTMKYVTKTVQTNFGCTVAEFQAQSITLVSEIDLPNYASDSTQKYTFTYEPTPGNSNNVTGRLASVTLPMGGTISYSYSGGSNGITCADGSAAGLTRTTPDGQWTYARSGSSPAWTTTVTDPQSNVTVLNFQGIYKTERQVYQGAAQPSNLLETAITCYNGNASNCNTTAVTLPITERSVTTQWGQSGLQEQNNTFYNGYGLITEIDDYDYASGPPFTLRRKTLTSYASLGNNIVDRPYQVTVQDGSGNTKAQTTYTYDQGTVTATSGTPQHVSVSGSRGNVTTVSQLVQTGSSLTKTFTYFDTGNVQTATDVNNAQASYSYGACGNSFPTQVSLPLSLSRSMIWDCVGGAATSITNENGKQTKVTYTPDQYFWRPNSTTDEAGNTTSITYPSGNVADSALSFNGGNSLVEIRATLDGLGRLQVSQRRQGPGAANYDSVETDYDSLGRPYRTTMPYSGTAGQRNSSGPATTTSYDALDRPTQVTDAGGGTVSMSYSQNDILRTLGPAPSGENTKRRQEEHDGLDRLTSVCELTAASGSGSCAQTSSQTGYWTKYTYDALSGLTQVVQNAQSGTTQTRSYSQDGLKRPTSETNPESGTTNYTYDSDTTCGTSNGDRVKRVDAMGNTTCYGYDALHRVTSIRHVSGSYASSTATRCYVYDSATVNGQTLANAKTRLAEAYTTSSSSCPGSGKITDIGFSYSVRGEVTDVYESTPHSGGYYHSTASYWANGALNTLNPLNSTALPTFTYSADGEGRPSQVSASAGTNPVSSTAYNVASQATGLTYGTGDSDAFSFDSNTGRITQYQFTVGSTPKSVTGQLGWNTNSTLASLGVTDQFNSADTQTCTYSYDDLARIAGGCVPEPVEK